jgi:hypothetical protein
MKRIILSIQHPAWAHQFKYIVEKLKSDGIEVIILAIDKDRACDLLDSFGFEYIKVSKSTGKNVVEKGALFIWLSLVYIYNVLKHKPSLLIGRANPMPAVASFICRKGLVIYEDTEVSRFSLRLCKLFSATIITSTSFIRDLGKKHIKVDTYKELFYLHPKYFKPDAELLISNGFNPYEKYVVVRFVSWKASHDYGVKGLNNNDKIKLVREISKHYRVYVTSEEQLCEELLPYELTTPYELIHHVLSFAQLYIGEGATMASESAVLGTYAIYINDLVSGSTRELDEIYGLMHCLRNTNEKYSQALKKTEELASVEDLKLKVIEKRDIMLADKIDINEYFLGLMSDYSI